jgi:hypothetical protein
MTALATCMLQLTLDTSAESAQKVEASLNRLANQPVSIDEQAMVASLPAHGRLLQVPLPATDRLLRVLHNLPRSGRQDAVRDSILAHQQVSRETASRYLICLYVTSLVLLILLIYLGLQLRRHVLALRRRAYGCRARLREDDAGMAAVG